MGQATVAATAGGCAPRAPRRSGVPGSSLRERRELHELVADHEPGAGHVRLREAHVAAEADAVVLGDAGAQDAAQERLGRLRPGRVGGADRVPCSSASSA